MPDDDLAKVIEVINDLARKAVGGNYIFRGEPKCYPKVSSSLYRQYHEIKVEGFDIEVVQRELLIEARKYTHETDDFEILTELQHYGGKTNLIDFTTDYLTALFFACDGFPDEDGRFVLVERSEEIKRHIHEPRNPANRVIAQKSIFLRPPKGFVEEHGTVTITSSLKLPILSYLRNCHDISTETVYNDLYGFIRVQDLHKSAYAEFYAGLTSYNKGDYKQAINHYTESLKLNPQLTIAYNNRGIAYGQKSDFDLAIQDLDKALSLNPDDAVAYHNRGNIYNNKGDYDLAIQDFDKALELNPNFAPAYINRGTAYNGKGDLDRTIQDYNKALALNSDDADVYNNRGVAYNSKGDFHHAIQDFNKALELNPNLAPAYSNRGNAYNGKGDLDRAIQDCNISLALDPNSATAYINRGIAHLRKGDFDRAIQNYDKAIELNLDYAVAYCNRGEAWLHLSEWEKARADLTKALDMGVGIVASFHNDYASIEDFERENDVALPEDIAEILGGRET